MIEKTHFYKILNVVTAALECMCFAGLFTGWPAAQFMFEKEGYFNQSCQAGESNQLGSNTTEKEEQRCDEQDQLLSLVVVVATSSMFVFSYCMGYIFDR